MTNNIQKRSGGCHCGAVRYEVEIDLTTVTRCNCTICTKISACGGFAKDARVTVTQGESALSTYARHPEIARRYFCKHCGVHCFGKGHLAELGGDFASVNVNTLDDVDPATLTVVHWDGRHDNWQAGPRPTPWPIAR